MLKRTVTALIATLVLIPILVFSKTIVLPIAASIVILISLYEMFNCIGARSKLEMTVPAYIMGVSVPIYTKVCGDLKGIVPVLCTIMILYLVYLLSVSVLVFKKYTVYDAAMVFMTSVYIIGGVSSIVFLREMSETNIYLLAFIGAWMTDIFAYFTGRFFGKHKLCEPISPKKTIEGSIGGIIFCSISFVVFAFINSGMGQSIGYYITFAAVGIIASVVSQVGDLTMSLIKRQYNIKDFGKIFPGHGGRLDRFDSVIAVALILFVILSSLSSFGLITII